jgi:hypothetical protein
MDAAGRGADDGLKIGLALGGGSRLDALIRLPTTTSHILDFTKAATIMEESEVVKVDVKRRLEEALGSRTRAHGNS